MKELISIPYESLEALADRLNSDLTNGRAIRFHNNGGAFVKDTEGKSLIHECPAYEGISELMTPDEIKSENFSEQTSGWLFKLHTSYNWNGKFFREGTLGAVVGPDRIKFLPDLNPADPVIIYGSREEHIGTGLNCHHDHEIDSPIYGPVIGILRPSSKVKGSFTFENIERVYWKRA